LGDLIVTRGLFIFYVYSKKKYRKIEVSMEIYWDILGIKMG